METIHYPPKRLIAFSNHYLITGKTGSGKSMQAEKILENIYQKGGYKLVDLYDEGRYENCLYGISTTDKGYIEKMGHLMLQKPREFPNKIYFICGRKLEFFDKLPANIEIVSFDMNDINISDCYYLFGASASIPGVIALIENHWGDKNPNLYDLRDIIAEGKFRGVRFNPRLLRGLAGSTSGMILRNLNRWIHSGMFSTKCKRFNFLEDMNDTKNITSFSMSLLDEDERVVAYGLIMKKIYEYKLRKQITPALRLYIRELSNFMSLNYSFPYFYLKKLLREGRDILGDNEGRKGGIIADTQTASDIKAEIRSQFAYFFLMKQDYFAAEKLTDIQEVPKKIIGTIPGFKAGNSLVLTGGSWRYPNLCPPSQHMHKSEGMDVLAVLGKKYGYKDINMSDYIDISKKEN